MPALHPPLWTLSIADVYESLGTAAHGLSSDEAIARFEKFGANELPEPAHRPLWLVYCGGTLCDIPVREIVPGDVLQVEEGDRISADARLVTAQALSVFLRLGFLWPLCRKGCCPR